MRPARSVSHGRRSAGTPQVLPDGRRAAGRGSRGAGRYAGPAAPAARGPPATRRARSTASAASGAGTERRRRSPDEPRHRPWVEHEGDPVDAGPPRPGAGDLGQVDAGSEVVALDQDGQPVVPRRARPRRGRAPGRRRPASGRRGRPSPGPADARRPVAGPGRRARRGAGRPAPGRRRSGSERRQGRARGGGRRAGSPAATTSSAISPAATRSSSSSGSAVGSTGRGPNRDPESAPT